MLQTYLTRTRQLLQNPEAPTALYSDADLTSWINQARGQTAGEGECIRKLGTVAAVIGQRDYAFTAISLGVSASTGIRGAIHVRQILLGMGGGYQPIVPRQWVWFAQYGLGNVVPENGEPTMWAQYGQGVAGTFYLDPPPALAYSLLCDCVCYPIDLVDDTTVEAIPYLWTDAVPYFAAYLALLSAQSGQRELDADRMFQRYTEFITRARRFANPDVLRGVYEQATDPAQVGKLGLQAGRSSQQAGGG